MKSSKSKNLKVKKAPRKDPTYGGVLHVTARARAARKADSGMLVWMTTGLVGLLCLGLVVWALWLAAGFLGRVLFTENPRFTVQEIAARSDGVLPEPLLVEWAGISPEANMFSISLQRVRERLEKNAIVKSAVVRRRLPGRIEIEVNERVAIARMGQVEGHMNWLLDAEGVLIRKSFQDKHLPFLFGVPQDVTLGGSIAGGRGDEALRYLAILRDMPAMKRELFDVGAISVGHPDYLDVRLNNGVSVLLPRNRNHRDVLERITLNLDRNQRLPEEQRMNLFDATPEGNNVIGSRTR